MCRYLLKITIKHRDDVQIKYEVSKNFEGLLSKLFRAENHSRVKEAIMIGEEEHPEEFEYEYYNMIKNNGKDGSH